MLQRRLDKLLQCPADELMVSPILSLAFLRAVAHRSAAAALKLYAYLTAEAAAVCPVVRAHLSVLARHYLYIGPDHLLDLQNFQDSVEQLKRFFATASPARVVVDLQIHRVRGKGHVA